MSDNSLTTIETDRCRYEVSRSQENGFGPVRLLGGVRKVKAPDWRDWLEVGEARALIAALQLVVDEVEREGQEKYDSHIEGQLAERKFISMPATARDLARKAGIHA